MTTGFIGLDVLLEGKLYPGVILELLSQGSLSGKTYLGLHVLCAAAMSAVSMNQALGHSDTVSPIASSSTARPKRILKVLYIDTSNSVATTQSIWKILGNSVSLNPPSATTSTSTYSWKRRRW